MSADPTLPPAPGPRGRPLLWVALAWLAILGAVGYTLWQQRSRPGADFVTRFVLLQSEGRFYVGMASYQMPGSGTRELYEKAKKSLEGGDYSKRLTLAILAGEMVGPGEARKELEQLEQDREEGTLEGRQSSIKAVRLLQRLYAGYEKDRRHPVLDEDDQEWLRTRLRWFGELALAPEGTADEEARKRVVSAARRAMFGTLGVAVGGLAALGIGCVLLYVAGALWYGGRIQPRMAQTTGHGNVYAEMFAFYLVLFLGTTYLLRQLPREYRSLWLSGAAVCLNLVLLFWPRVRGLSWGQIRTDLGLEAGRGVFREFAFGVGTYFAALPVVLLGVTVMLVMVQVGKLLGLDPLRGGGPYHPVVFVTRARDWWPWVQVFFLVSVAAPVVEEIMFRGALYRHLREAARWLRVGSVAVASLVSSFVFAVIHPQGWLAVPMLMGLAVVFALSREWRGTLIPAMTAHSIHNGVLVLILLVVAG